jgi:probable HAF family extracellular repeat protein
MYNPLATTVFMTATNQGQAYTEGQTEALNAIHAIQALGGNLADTIIYYDIENYDTTNSACVSIVKYFLNGWIYGLHSAVSGNYSAGIYGNVAPMAQNFSQLSPLPDDVWIALAPLGTTPPKVTIWGLASGNVSLCDTYSAPAPPPCPLWSNEQRIHQYIADGANKIKYYETWGGVKLEIDPDIIDADVAHPATGTKIYTYNFTPLTLNGNEDYPYSINNIGVTNPNYGSFINASQSDISGNIGQALGLEQLWSNGLVIGWGNQIWNPDTGVYQAPPPYPQLGNCYGTQRYQCTQMAGINNAGWIVGSWMDLNGINHGFLNQAGSLKSFDAPGASVNGTFGTAINDAGLIVGYYQDSSGVYHGFLYNAVTQQFVAAPLDYTGGGGTYLRSINGQGEIIGDYGTSVPLSHFLYSNGNFAEILTNCESGAWYVLPESINNNGQIAGYYATLSGNFEYLLGFVSYDGGLSCSTVEYPAPEGTEWTELYGINDAGQISGSWFSSANNSITGFVAVPQTP